MLKKLQQTILPRQKVINRGLVGVQAMLLIAWVVVVMMTIQDPLFILSIGQVGKLLGSLSLVLFCVTLMPGILTRLKVWTEVSLPVATLITPFRRNLGILMFITAFVHMSLTTSLPFVALELSQLRTVLPLSWMGKIAYAISVLPPPLRLFEQVAIIGWILLLPVWLTSNNFAQKKLGKWWKRVQRLTYVAIWFIMGHVALQSSLWTVVVGAVAVLEVASWVKVRTRKK